MPYKKTLRRLCDAMRVESVSSTDLWMRYAKASILGLCYHSAKAVGGTLFFCLVGKSADGHSYAPAAYRAGCRVFVVERMLELPEDCVQIRVPNAREALADSAAVFYDHPEKELRLIGLTGTKGKTTTAYLIRALLEGADIPTGYIGTNGVDYAEVHHDTLNSTPESVEIYRYLREMADAGMQACVLEVSSQALWMRRVQGLIFDTTVFTNLSRDHIGGVEHPDMTHYRASKKKLFSDYPARMVVVNADDAASAYMVEDLSCGKDQPRLLAFSTAEGETIDAPVCPPLWCASEAYPARRGDAVGVTFTCRRGGRVLDEPWFLPLPGIFSVQNALAALTVACEGFGVSEECARRVLAEATVPGRFEAVTHPGLPGVAFVIDYAHNGVSLAAILDALRDYEPERLIALFGSVGGRTKERRRDMAEAAGPRCDLCILTSDNPSVEPPADIIREIDEAFPTGACPRICITDRAEAIRYAVEIAEEGDIILLAGKGHEAYQLIGVQRLPFSERELLEAALEARAAAEVFT